MPSEISPEALGISISKPGELRSKNEQSETPDLPISPQTLGIDIPEAEPIVAEPEPTAEPKPAEPPKAPFTGLIPSTMATLKPQKVDEFGRPVDESGKPLYDLDEPKFGPEVDKERPLVISTDKSKPNYIKRAVTKLSDMLGIDYEPKLSDEARAQAVVQLMAREEGVPLHEYRQSPELIEQAASSLVNAATFGIYPSLRESLTGEVDYEPTDTSGYVGYALGSLGGMMLGPFRAAETAMRPIMRYIPRATREERLAARILKESLHDAAILGTASGMMAVGEAGKETKFSDIASNIWNSTVSGTLTGTLFGLSRGMFPADGAQTGYRLMTGLTALNAQRAMETGTNPFTDRPAGEVLFDIALDSLFLYKALPGRRAEKVAEDVARISDRARDIKAKEALLESIPDEAVKKAQENIVNVEKQQLELEKQNVAGEVISDVAVAEEISKQKKSLAKKKTISKLQVEPQALETAEAEFVSKKGNRYYKINGSWYSSDGIEITNNFVIKAAEKYGKPREEVSVEPAVKAEAEPAKLAKAETVEEIRPEAIIPIKPTKPVETEPVQAEPLRSKIEQTEPEPKAKKPKAKKPKVEVPKPADVDMVAGEEKLLDLKGENSPFFQNRETTEIHKKLFAERSKSVSEDIELFTQKLINDANRWYHGEDVDITSVRNALSEFSARGAEARMQFVSGSDHFEWHQVVKEAAEWARSLERKGEPAEPVKTAIEEPKKKTKSAKGVRLNIMVPVDEFPKAVRDFISSSGRLAKKLSEGKIKPSDLLRNKELWQNTGFWLGRDGLWRYELVREDVGPNIKEFVNKRLEDYGGKTIKLVDILGHDNKVFESAPELRDMNIYVNPDLSPSSGRYNPETNTIEISNYVGENVLYHEIQHAVNSTVNAFSGGTPGSILRDDLLEFIDRLDKEAKTEDIRGEIEHLRNYILGDRPRVNIISLKLIDITEKVLPGKAREEIIDDIGTLFDKNRLYDKYTLIPGEMEARLSEVRTMFPESIRRAEPPWETLDVMLESEGHKKSAGTTLYSGIDPIKAISDMVELARPFVGDFFRSLKAKEFDPAYALKRLKADTVKAFIDQQEPLLKYIRKHYPETAEQLIAKQRAAVTGKGYGKEVYDQIYAEVYKGKPKRMVDLINMLSLATRFNAIYSYRSEKSYKHQPGYSAKSSSALFELSNLLKNLNDAQLKVLRKKVPGLDDIYKNYTAEEIAEALRANEVLSEWHRKMVDDLVEAGRHSKEEGELLKKHDYRRFRSIRIDNIFDLSYSVPLKGETIKFTNSGVQALGGGSTKMLEPDYRNVLAEQAARVYGTIANEIAKREWKKFAEEHPNNGIVSIGSGRPEGWNQINIKLKEGEKPVYYSKSDINKDANLSKLSQRELYEYYKQHPEDKRFVTGTGEPSPKDWSSMPYFEDGIKKKLYFHPDAVDYLVTRSHDISPRFAKMLRTGTLAPLTRSLAVSTSPVWATFVGLPMDFFHTLWTARTWEADRRGIRPKTSYPFYEVTKGKFKSVYSPFNPLDSLMLGKDIASVVKDIYSKGPFYKALMKHGMAMPWLSMREARYTKGLKQPGEIDKIIDALGYHGKSLEVAVRAAVAKRVLMRDAKKKGITFDEAMQDNELMYRAVHAARDRMDYNQGGWVIKALDQSGFMFLNAGVLGARTFWRTAVDNPVSFFMRTGRVGIAASGITAAIWLMYPEIAKQMASEEGNEKDLKIPIFPDKIKVYDKDGNEGVFYFKLRMDPGQAFLYRTFEALTQTYLYDAGLIDQEPDYEKLVGTLKRLGPVGISLPPLLQFFSDYVTNYSWWRGRMMYTDMGGRKISWPKSGHEGEFDVNVSQLAKDVGKVTGLSPKRLGGAAGNIFPQNNEFVWLFNQVYNQTLSDVPDEVAKEHWLISLADVPGVNRVFGISWSGSRVRDIARDVETEEDIESVIRHGKFEFMAKNYYWYEYGSESEIDRFIDSFEDPNIRKSLEAKKEFVSKTANLPNRDTWVSTFYMSPEGKAKMMYKVYDGNLVEIDKMLDRLLEAGYLGRESIERFYTKIDELKSQQQ